jgi:hypothetical protein
MTDDRETEEELKGVYEVLGRVVMENIDLKKQIRRMEDRMLAADTDDEEKAHERWTIAQGQVQAIRSILMAPYISGDDTPEGRILRINALLK